MTERDVTVYLHDILESISEIESYIQDIDESTFLTDRKTQDSVIRRLEVIGEAVRAVPNTIRDHYDDVPWRQIAGMRDILIHEYFGVNLERVWETVQVDIPHLKNRVKEMLANLQKTK